MNAAYWIETLSLQPHPEGGHFRRVYTSVNSIDSAALPAGYRGPRPVASAIYYLLEGAEFSSLHRLKSDEIWHFYTGSPLTVHIIDERRRYAALGLGNDPQAGQRFQAVIRGGWWFGATVDDPDAYTLIGCTVAPGFDFDDFELGQREALLRLYPEHERLIRRLTR